jgi:hypothetical protein
MRVIGVAGQCQTGKDTIADRLQGQLDKTGDHWERSAFAKGVKRIFSETFGVSCEFIEEWKTKDEVPPELDMEVRQGLQFVGDGFRKIKSSIWIDLVFRDKAASRIISDVRYPNEFARVFYEGGLNILVGRPDKLNDDQNGSEALIKPYVEYALKNWRPNLGKQVWEVSDLFKGTPPNMNLFHLFVCNNGTKEDLYQTIDEVVTPYVKNFQFT